jgi:hypothetical protein
MLDLLHMSATFHDSYHPGINSMSPETIVRNLRFLYLNTQETILGIKALRTSFFMDMRLQGAQLHQPTPVTSP